jgi:hypothetical protein
MKLLKKTTNRVILFVIVILLSSYMLTLPLEKVLFAVDFTEYWSASRLVLEGDNPYSVDAMWQLQSKLPDWPYDHPVKMYNPPWVISIILPLGLLPYEAARLLWLFFSIIIIIYCMDVCWRLYLGPANQRWISWVLGIAFLPTIGCLDLGQISFLILLGIVAFMDLLRKQKWFLSGAAAFLIAIKPQIMVLFWLLLLFWMLTTRHWKILLGTITAGLGALALPLLFNPKIISQYLEFTASAPPYYFEVPTIAFALRLIFGFDQIWLQYIPTIIGLGWLVFYWKEHQQHWDWLDHLPLVIIISFVTASFAWSFDQIILLPILIQSAVWIGKGFRKRWYFAAAYLVITGLIFVFSITVPGIPFWNLWQAPALLALYLLILKALQKEKTALVDGLSAAG